MQSQHDDNDPGYVTPTRKQQAFLDRHDLQPDHPIGRYEAWNLIGRHVWNCRQLSPTTKQQNILKAHGRWRDGLTRGQAFDLIEAIFDEMNASDQPQFDSLPSDQQPLLENTYAI